MTDFELLDKAIKDSGMPMTTLAERSKIKRETLYNRIKGIGEFTASEIVGLCEALHINNDDREKIFFATKVE